MNVSVEQQRTSLPCKPAPRPRGDASQASACIRSEARGNPGGPRCRRLHPTGDVTEAQRDGTICPRTRSDPGRRLPQVRDPTSLVLGPRAYETRRWGWNHRTRSRSNSPKLFNDTCVNNNPLLSGNCPNTYKRMRLYHIVAILGLSSPAG